MQSIRQNRRFLHAVLKDGAGTKFAVCS